MPPWHVERNIGIQKFKDDPSLTEQEIATIAAWVDQGAPKGDMAQMPPPRTFADEDVWHIGKPDLIVEIRSRTRLRRPARTCGSITLRTAAWQKIATSRRWRRSRVRARAR